MNKEIETAVQNLLDEFDFLKEEYEGLKEDYPNVPRMLFVISDIAKQDPSACAKAILTRIANAASISTEDKSISQLVKELMSFWSDKNAPQYAKMFTGEFRSQVRDLIRKAVEADKKYQKALSSLEVKGRKTGTYVSLSNGKTTINQEISPDTKDKKKENVNRLIKDFRKKLDAVLNGKTNVAKSEVIAIAREFIKEVLEKSMEELGVPLKQLPITELAVELSREAIDRLIAPQWSDAVRAADEVFKQDYGKVGYDTSRFRSSFHDRLHIALDEAYSLGQRAYTGGGAKR